MQLSTQHVLGAVAGLALGDLAAVGLSATIAVAPAATLDRAITQAQRQIEQAKLAGARGRVLITAE